MGQLRKNSVRQINSPLGDIIRLGDWYWYKPDEDEEELYCVTAIGSNYLGLRSPIKGEYRVHLDSFDLLCRHEPEADAVLEARARECIEGIREALEAIRGIDTRLCLGEGSSGQDASTTALSLYSGDDKAEHYERNLVAAKKELIPAQKEKIEASTRMLDTWVRARTYPLEGEVERIDKVMEKIDGRLLDLSIYAGLSERVDEIRKGKHTKATEPIHIMQRLLYMDEECLLRYQHGGMEFKQIAEFDRWLAMPENADRLLPFPRCVVGFRVRRISKRREVNTFLDVFVNIRLAEMDEYTFLYIRNGDALYRICSEHEFGAYLFPLESDLSFTEPMVGVFDDFGKFQYFQTLREAEDQKREREKLEQEQALRSLYHRSWCRKHRPNEHRRKQRKQYIDPFWDHASPFYRYRSLSERRTTAEPFDVSSVYYDDMVEEIQKQIQDYNRLSLLLQGLLDRSVVFLPHPGIRMWDTASAQEYVKLIHDGSNTLHHGEAPDFEDYRNRCNKGLRRGSLVIGQAAIWRELQEEEWKENRYLSRYERRSTKYAGSGPPLFARIRGLRDGVASFEWYEESLHYYGKKVRRRLKVPIKKLLNAEAYRPGDYLQFFVDPRTRSEYMKWAPLLLFCEEFVANNIDENGDPIRKSRPADESFEEFEEDEEDEEDTNLED